MEFATGHLYHIYNQGNNKQKIFFCRENYFYFLRKIEKHVLPFADVLAWCLMPNHFHLMVHVNHAEIDELLFYGKSGSKSEGDFEINPNNNNTPLSRATTCISFNKSLGIMLASYTRAINIQECFSGSLFRQKTKAICLTCIDGVTPAWHTVTGITKINSAAPEKQYPNSCFNYIAFNPVKAGLVNNTQEWEFSSFSDKQFHYYEKLINRNRIEEYGLVLRKSECDFK